MSDVADDSGHWFDLGQKSGFKTAAAMLALEYEGRVRRGNPPRQGWQDAVAHLQECAEELSVRPLANPRAARDELISEIRTMISDLLDDEL